MKTKEEIHVYLQKFEANRKRLMWAFLIIIAIAIGCGVLLCFAPNWIVISLCVCYATFSLGFGIFPAIEHLNMEWEATKNRNTRLNKRHALEYFEKQYRNKEYDFSRFHSIPSELQDISHLLINNPKKSFQEMVEIITTSMEEDEIYATICTEAKERTLWQYFKSFKWLAW